MAASELSLGESGVRGWLLCPGPLYSPRVRASQALHVTYIKDLKSWIFSGWRGASNMPVD